MSIRQRVEVWALLGAALICGCTSSTDQAQSKRARTASPDTHWGEPANSMVVGLSYLRYVERPSPTLMLQCHLKNVGNTPLSMPDLNRRVRLWDGAPPILVMVNGQPIYRRSSDEATLDASAAAGPAYVLKPGQEVTADIPMVLSHWGLAPPLKNLSLQLRLLGGSVEQTAGSTPAPKWLGEAYSGQLVLPAVPQ